MNDQLTYLLLLHGCVAGAIACLMRGAFLRRQPGTSHVFANLGGTYLARGAAASKMRTVRGEWVLAWRALQCASVFLLRTATGLVNGTLRRAGRAGQHLRAFMDRSLTPMALVDQEGSIRYANPALANLWPADLLSGRSLFALADITPLTEAIRTVREKGAWSGEILLRRSDGSLMAADASATLVTDGNGRQPESLWMFRDQSALAAQLCQAQKMEPMGRLAAGIAHDFNNLLTVIQGYSSLALAKPGAGHAYRTHFEEIRKAAARGSELAQQLLTVGRPRPARREMVSLPAVISDCTGLLRQLAGNELELAFGYRDAGCVAVDPSQLQQVLLNLVANARDASPEGGRITVAVDRAYLDEESIREHAGMAPGSYVALSVSDNGSGMDRATLARIFDPFFTTKEPGKGTGLGLPMVLRIVKEHGGCISVNSKPGIGTIFRLYFPEAQESQPKAPGLTLTATTQS